MLLHLSNKPQHFEGLHPIVSNFYFEHCLSLQLVPVDMKRFEVQEHNRIRLAAQKCRIVGRCNSVWCDLIQIAEVYS